jgi:hypothetical protein
MVKNELSIQNLLSRLTNLLFVAWFLIGCSSLTTRPVLAPTPTDVSNLATRPTETPFAAGLSGDEIATLNSLEKIDDYPLYTLHYQGGYDQGQASWDIFHGSAQTSWSVGSPAWACSLFAALGDAENMLYGRNFDWGYSPAVLLFTEPPDGYASVSMVDIAFLDIPGSAVMGLDRLPIIERQALLSAPFWPFDGMNEQGLSIGMAAVPSGEMQPDPSKMTIGSLIVIRQILDHASNVDEALAIFQSYNIDMLDGPPLHYLIAERSGRAVLVEFYQGEMVLFPNEKPWHMATNFLVASTGNNPEGHCGRYDQLSRSLGEAGGRLNTQSALDLLAKVAQVTTQWSIVYQISTGDVSVVMGRAYGSPHTLHLDSVDAR